MPIRWKLHEVMAKMRLRNKDLAEALQITENSVYRLRKVNDMPRLTPERLEGICATLRCQPGDLLEWVAEGEQSEAALSQVLTGSGVSNGPSNPIVVPHTPQALRNVSRSALQRLTQYYQPILALAWQGYREFGPGAVVFTDLEPGPKLAYVERLDLSDRSCLEAVDQNDPEVSAVVLYYKDQDYSSADYTLLTLTGPKTPPECFAFDYSP
jgi:putative transcriptional regulator